MSKSSGLKEREMRPDKTTIMETMEIIESRKLDAILNAASSFSLFLKAAYQKEAPKQLIKDMQDSPKNIWLVLQRTVELTQKEIDLRYETPWDTALTIYMWALSLVDLEIAETAAGFVAEADNCWWAKKMAEHILSKQSSNNSGFHRLNFNKIKETHQQNGGAKIEYSVKTYSSLSSSGNIFLERGSFERTDEIVWSR